MWQAEILMKTETKQGKAIEYVRGKGDKGRLTL